jgi:hypothetical protein
MPRSGPPPPHPLSLLRGEFVWEGKYDADGRRREPALLQPPPSLEPAERWPGPAWDAPGSADPPPAPNLLLGGDNLLALAALLPAYRGQVQLIYLDPPFDSGAAYPLRVPLGAGGAHRAGRGTGAGHLELVAYRDAWGSGADSYLQRMYERLVLMRTLLRESGVLCLHCDWRSHAPLRLLLDEVFGPERFLNEIVWYYYNKYSPGRRHLPRAHDSLLLYARGARPALNALRLAREAPGQQLVRKSVNGVLRNARDAQGRLSYRTVLDRKADDVWRIPQLQPASREWSGYGTQKHHALLERLVALTSREGDLVADFFCGSGTTLAVAERMGRRWIGCDQGALALHTTRKRLLRARDPRPPSRRSARGGVAEPVVRAPFAVVSLADAARRAWRQREFGSDTGAYRRHLLEALGAEPAQPYASWPDGWLDGAPCVLPELDAPCTPAHALTATRAARQAGATRLFLLAWDYDPRFWSALDGGERAPLERVPLIIPEALTSPAGNAPAVFRALPRLELQGEVSRPHDPDEEPGRNRVTLTLRGHAPGPARPAWSGRWEPPPALAGEPLALLDGWALDPAWRPGAPFRHDWWSVRTPHGRALAERSEPLPLNGGQPCVMAMDVWGLVTLHAPILPRAAPRRP